LCKVFELARFLALEFVQNHRPGLVRELWLPPVIEMEAII